MFRILVILLITFNFLSALELNEEEKNWLKNHPVINLGYSTNFEPLYIEKNSDIYGVIPDFYKLIEDKLNIKFNYITKNWNNVLSDAKIGKIDFIPLMNKETAQQNELITTSNIFKHLFRVFTKNDTKLEINSLDDMKNLKISYVKSILVLDRFLKENFSSDNLLPVENTFDAFSKVLNSKADIAIVSNAAGSYTIKKNFLTEVKPIYTLKELKVDSVAGVNKNIPIFADILSKTINSISSEEKLSIYKKWIETEPSELDEMSILTKKEKQQLEDVIFNIYVTNWEPFTIHSKKSVEGISVEIWEKIVSKSNIKFNYIKDRNFAEALNFIKNDKNGMIIATSSTKEREVYGSFTKPIVSFPVSIATNINKNFIVDLKELEGKSVAVGKSYTAYFLLKEHYPKINLVPVKDTIEALDLLANGKVFAAADILPVLIYNMNKYNFTNLKISGTSKFNFDVKFMLNKKNEHLIPILNKFISTLNENQKKDIVNHWIYIKQITKVNYQYLIILGIISFIIIFFILYRQRILNANKFLIEKERIKYKNLMDLASDMIYLSDYNGKVIEYSKQTQVHLGYNDEEMKSLTIFDVDRLIGKEEFDNICNSITEKPTNFQALHTKKNGQTYYADITAVKITIDDEKLIYTSVRDITKQQALLKEIKIVKNRFENMFRTHESIMLLIDPKNSRIIDANNSASNFYGYTKEEFKNLYTKDINTLSNEEIKKRIEEAISQNKNEFIFPHKLKDGSIKTVEVFSSPIETEKGKILFSIIKDITKQKELEIQIINEKNFISNILNNANSVIAVIDSNGLMTTINKYAQDFVGYTKEEISSESYFWSRFLREDEKAKVLEIIEKAKKGEIVKAFKNSWISKTNEERIFEWSNTLVKKEDGSMDYIVTLGVDVTDKEKIQNKILEQKQEFESIFKYSKDGIAITDLETNFLEFNESYQQITGYEKEELLQKSSLDLSTEEHKERMKKQIELAILNGHVENYEKESIAKNRRIIVNMSISLLPDKKRLLIVIKDITLLKQVEHQSKLMAMGEMIGNIAHQWRQPLSVITSAISGLRVKSELELLDKQDIVDVSDVVIKQSNYLSNTIDNFRNFIKEDHKTLNFSLNNSIKNALGILEATLKNSYIKLVLNIEDDITLNGNINELSEAFINIMTNSKDIIKERINENDTRLIFVTTKKINDSTIELKFLDNGGGLDENLIHRILEPYFTTKHQSQGTGLGLSITDKIIRERYNGLINIYNEDFEYENINYRGLCFTIIFKLK